MQINADLTITIDKTIDDDVVTIVARDTTHNVVVASEHNDITNELLDGAAKRSVFAAILDYLATVDFEFMELVEA